MLYNEFINLWYDPEYADIRFRLMKQSFDELAFAVDLGTEQSLNYGSPWFRPPIPLLAGAISLLGDCIAPVLKGDCEVEEGLNKAQKGIQELLKKAGY